MSASSISVEIKLIIVLFHHIFISTVLPPADAINNAAGFGFNGYDSDGSPRWDLISNLRILNIEVRLRVNCQLV